MAKIIWSKRPRPKRHENSRPLLHRTTVINVKSIKQTLAGKGNNSMSYKTGNWSAQRKRNSGIDRKKKTTSGKRNKRLKEKSDKFIRKDIKEKRKKKGRQKTRKKKMKKGNREKKKSKRGNKNRVNKEKKRRVKFLNN